MRNPPATLASFIANRARIHHVTCGGRMRHEMRAVSYFAEEIWICQGCKQEWPMAQLLKNKTDAWFEMRFDLRGDFDPQEAVLVWVTEEGKTFLRSVPQHEASKHRPFDSP